MLVIGVIAVCWIIILLSKIAAQQRHSASLLEQIHRDQVVMVSQLEDLVCDLEEGADIHHARCRTS